MANEKNIEFITKKSATAKDMHYMIASLREELEAIDWYNQRIEDCQDDELRSILAHNRDEEKEHAAMLLEWMRRRDTVFADELKGYLFSDTPITD